MEFSGLTYQRNKKRILKGISFKLHASGINWIFGPNGAGKTSVLKIISGMENNYKGNLPSELIKAAPGSIGFLLEHGSYYGHLTIMENLSLFIKIYKIPTDRIHKFLDCWGLASYKKIKVGQLSIGLRSRFSLVMALLSRPQYILLDEPESALDFQGSSLLLEHMESWRKTGAFIVIVSHYPHGVSPKDHLLVMEEGVSIFHGPVRDFLAYRFHEKQEYLSYLQKAMLMTARQCS